MLLTIPMVDPCTGEDVSCASCGNQQRAGTLAGLRWNWQKCSRCQKAFYCNRDCQREHWKRGGHKQACKEPAKEPANKRAGVAI